MAITKLPTDYVDAEWSGLKKYEMISNDDGTTSFRDVTAYTQREKSFFGAKQANQIGEAYNSIVGSAVKDVKNVTVSKTSFTAQSSGTPTNYTYRATISNSDIKSTHVCELYPSQASADLGVLSNTCTSFDGGIYIYASEIPESNIVFNRISYREENA